MPSGPGKRTATFGEKLVKVRLTNAGNCAKMIDIWGRQNHPLQAAEGCVIRPYMGQMNMNRARGRGICVICEENHTY